MDNNLIECPQCGNVQPKDSHKCFKCGFNINSYIKQVNKRIRKNGRNPEYFYEISPQWQQYLAREKARNNVYNEVNTKPTSKFKRIVTSPYFVVLSITAVLGIIVFINFSKDYDNYKNNKEASDKNKTVTTTVPSNPATRVLITDSPSNVKTTNTPASNKATNTPAPEKSANTPIPEKDNEPPVPTESIDETDELSFETQNAIRSAETYLSVMGFSKLGLIEMLEYNGYSNESATEAVNTLTVDWNEQAVKCAKTYLNYMAFSRSGLTEMLKNNGFTDEQAEYAADAVGY